MANPKDKSEKSNDVQYQSLENIADTTATDFLQSDTLCGCGPCHPASAQPLSNPIVFTAHAGLLLAVLLATATYFNGIITTIERQFQVSSSEVAVLSVINDASSLCVILFVSYFGHKSHRPRWIAVGAVLMAIGLILCALPHFLLDPIDPHSLISGGTDTSSRSRTALQSLGVCDTSLKSTSKQGLDLHSLASNSSVIEECKGESSKGMGPVKWLVVGQIILGVGSAPSFPLVLSYIDDAVKKHKFTSYTAFLFIAIMLGPIGGMFLTSAATSLYVDFDRVPADEIPDLEHYDPRWIGAWWIGFPLFAILLVVGAIPLCFYPKVMTPKLTETCAEEDLEKDDKADDTTSVMSIQMITKGMFLDTSGGIIAGLKGIVLAIKRLVFNGPLMLIFLGVTAETALGAISSIFQVKYYQTQFGASPATAAMLMGGIMVPCVAIAQVVSAFICRKYKLNTKQCARFIFSCHLLAFFFFGTSLFVGCENSPVAGVNTPYWISNEYATSEPGVVSMSPRYQPIETLQLKSTCNSECACQEEIFRPVCGANGLSYISPCHAGCTQFNASGLMRYSECACIFTRNSTVGDVIDDTAVLGLCRESCDTAKQLTILMAVSLIAIFAMSLTFNPQVFLFFRLVEPDDRSICMGFNAVITKCLAFFPAPIIMGMVINSTCTLWQYVCGDRGSCWLYDTTTYRYLFIGVISGLKFLSVVCYGAAALVIKPSKEEDNVEPNHNLNEKSAVI